MLNSRTHLDWYPLELVSYYTITRPSTDSGMLLIGTSFWCLFHSWVKAKWSSISLGFSDSFVCLPYDPLH
jgi:hypothetical protein